MVVVVLRAFVELSKVIEVTLSNSLDPLVALAVAALAFAVFALVA